MDISTFTKWYMKHVIWVVSGSDPDDKSYKILKRVEELKIIERLEKLKSFEDKEPKEEKKKHDWKFISEVVFKTLSFVFNVMLCGMIFAYERFAPIITKAFAFVRPMPI